MRVEHEYERRGALAYLAAWDVHRARLFGRFVRGQEPDGDEGSGGSGLGLYVWRELCRAMDGDLVLEPTVAGRGASFSVYLPGEPPDDS